MNRRAAIAGARVPAAPVRSLLVLALIAASPAWAQEATDAASAASTASPVAPVASSTDAAAAPQPAEAQVDPSVLPSAENTTTTDAAPAPASASADALQAPPTTDATPPTPATATSATATPPATEATTTPPAATGAESDFNELYGTTAADGSGTTAPAAVYDPWEPYNRRMHRFNNAVDRHVAKPLAKAYVKVVPRPVRSGVSNFFSNLGQPITAINSLLQGQPKRAAHSAGRFVVNSTVGIAGVFDPATRIGLENANEDFGQTLGVWGWKRSRYVELPFFGPRTLRDIVGMVGDAPLSPLRQVEMDKVRVPLQGLQLVDLRATLMSTDALREGAEDDYRLVRDAWLQRRAYQIDGGDADTPDYLKDDRPIVPVNAMPVSGGH